MVHYSVTTSRKISPLPGCGREQPSLNASASVAPEFYSFAWVEKGQLTFSTPNALADWVHEVCERQPEAAKLLNAPAEEQHGRGYFHTLHEILQQPATWIRTAQQILERTTELRECLKGARLVVLTGCGHAGIVNIVLALIIWSGYPGTAEWVLGLLFGVNLLLWGISLTMTAISSRTA